jgi:hypothetical protein
MPILRFAKTLALLIPLFSFPLYAQGTGSTMLSLSVGAQCGVFVLSSSQSETSSGKQANEYTGTVTFQYFVRTATGTGSGNLQLELVLLDDSSRVDSSGAALSYAMNLSGVGTASSGRQTISSPSANITVASFGADQHTSKQGSTGTLTWTFDRDSISPTRSLAPTVTLNMACR